MLACLIKVRIKLGFKYGNLTVLFQTDKHDNRISCAVATKTTLNC